MQEDNEMAPPTEPFHSLVAACHLLTILNAGAIYAQKKKCKPIRSARKYKIRLCGIYWGLGKKKSLSEAERWGNLHNSWCASWHAMHNGKRWVKGARVFSGSAVGAGKPLTWEEMEGGGGGGGGKVGADECEGESRHLRLFLTPSPVLSTTFRLFLTLHPPVRPHYTHLSFPIPSLRSPNPTFYPIISLSCL